MTRIPELSRQPLKIHQLLALRTIWNEDLWNEVLEYLLASVSTQEAIQMTALLGDEDTDSLFKIDYLREFRSYPPSAVLAAFDLIRLNRL